MPLSLCHHFTTFLISSIDRVWKTSAVRGGFRCEDQPITGCETGSTLEWSGSLMVLGVNPVSLVWVQLWTWFPAALLSTIKAKIIHWRTGSHPAAQQECHWSGLSGRNAPNMSLNTNTTSPQAATSCWHEPSEQGINDKHSILSSKGGKTVKYLQQRSVSKSFSLFLFLFLALLVLLHFIYLNIYLFALSISFSLFPFFTFLKYKHSSL